MLQSKVRLIEHKELESGRCRTFSGLVTGLFSLNSEGCPVLALLWRGYSVECPNLSLRKNTTALTINFLWQYSIATLRSESVRHQPGQTIFGDHYPSVNP